MIAAILVKPGVRTGWVGGRFSEPGKPDVLLVGVPARAVEGQANRAVCRTLAAALGVRASQVQIISGQLSRHKRVEVPDQCAARWEHLLAGDPQPVKG